MNDEFRKELTGLINKHSLENGSDTPDYIIADYLIRCLEGMNMLVNTRERSYEAGKIEGAREALEKVKEYRDSDYFVKVPFVLLSDIDQLLADLEQPKGSTWVGSLKGEV